MKNVEIYGVKIAEATPQEVADLKKLLEPQMHKITWTTPYWQYPHYTITSGTTISSETSIRDTTTYDYRSATSNDLNYISSNGSSIQNIYLTN